VIGEHQSEFSTTNNPKLRGPSKRGKGKIYGMSGEGCAWKILVRHVRARREHLAGEVGCFAAKRCAAAFELIDKFLKVG
jgi:hypothetical protein